VRTGSRLACHYFRPPPKNNAFGDAFRPMLLPNLSALLSLKQPLKPEVTSLMQPPAGEGHLGGGGGTSTLNLAWNNHLGWKHCRRHIRSRRRDLNRSRTDGSTAENGRPPYTFFSLYLSREQGSGESVLYCLELSSRVRKDRQLYS